MNPFNLVKRDRTQLQAETPDIIAAGISDVGFMRAINEDRIWIHDSGEVMLLADGMGGHERGADASRIAIDTLSDLLSPEKINSQSDDVMVLEGIPADIAPVYTIIHRAVKRTAAVIAERNSELKLSKYMGTTVAGFVLAEKNHVFWFHVGDSRVYRLREGRLKRLTVDHSLFAEWEKAGALGEAPAKHVITRVLANDPEAEADIDWDKRKRGDIYLLCSDGLNDMISDTDIEKIFNREKSIPETAEMLVSEALSAGGRDNVSVIICEVL